MKHMRFPALLGMGLLALAACQADKASAPRNNQAAQPVDAVAETGASDDASGLGASLEDAAGRLAPALEDPGARTEVARQLRMLSQAIAGGNVARSRVALVAAREALARAGLSPDAAAIGLALDRAEERISAGMVDGSAQSNRGTAIQGDLAH